MSIVQGSSEFLLGGCRAIGSPGLLDSLDFPFSFDLS
ncbi:hypothetical protein GZL_09205 [Streptomyces sp. 769]|nr:hypothetical protein GZL_09205 [Streptomyces sp. 769]